MSQIHCCLWSASSEWTGENPGQALGKLKTLPLNETDTSPKWTLSEYPLLSCKHGHLTMKFELNNRSVSIWLFENLKASSWLFHHRFQKHSIWNLNFVVLFGFSEFIPDDLSEGNKKVARKSPLFLKHSSVHHVAWRTAFNKRLRLPEPILVTICSQLRIFRLERAEYAP